jgi:hypothetical protein
MWTAVGRGLTSLARPSALCLSTQLCPLYGLAALDPLMQADGFQGRVDAELAAERFDAGSVLAQREMGLALSAVAAHQPTVRVLAARIALEDALTQSGAGSIAALAEVEITETADSVQPGEA